MNEPKIRYGIPQPIEKIEGLPAFKEEGSTLLFLSDYPENEQPSGGMSNRISRSEMYMVQADEPIRMIWRQAHDGKVIADVSGLYSYIGRFPWEITMPGMFFCDIQRQGKDVGFVEFEVR